MTFGVFTRLKTPFRCDYSTNPSEPCEGFCIPLTMDRHAIVDTTDADIVNLCVWAAHKDKSGTFYAKGMVCRKQLYLHREIAKPSKGLVVDHISGNALDNRRANLRICRPSQNTQNQKARKNKASPYRGVFPYKGKWRAHIKHKGVRYNLGAFPTQEGAALAFDMAAIQYHGDFARLNNPPLPKEPS